MTDHRDWTGKVGEIWAQEWRRTDRSFRALTPLLLDRARRRPFRRALDIGCGAGEIACELAQDHAEAKIVGVDISPELLAVARKRAARFPNVQFVHGDAALYGAGSGEAFDLLVSRHGVMFFAEPSAAFARLRRQAASGARLVFSCFRARAENAWVAATLTALPEPPAPPEPREPGPFAFGEQAYVAGILADAGWREIGFEAIDYSMVFGEGADPVADATDYLSRVGPTATPIAALPEADRAATLARLSAILDGHSVAGRVELSAAAWLVTARAP